MFMARNSATPEQLGCHLVVLITLQPNGLGWRRENSSHENIHREPATNLLFPKYIYIYSCIYVYVSLSGVRE